MGTTLISTFYSFQPFVAAAHAFSPTKIVLVVAEDSLKNSRVMEDMAKVREVYGKVASIEVVKVPGADFLAIASRTVGLIEREKDNRVIVNISGGWKLLSQGAVYGCYARPELVEKIVCNNIEDGTVVELPKLGFGLSTAKKGLLEEIVSRKGRPISEIADKLEKTRGMLYQHLKELRELGYVDEKFEITLSGRIALL